MNTNEKLDAIKMALIETNRDELVDYVNDVAQHIAEQDKTIEMMGEPAPNESLEELLQPSTVIQSMTVNIYHGSEEKNK